MPLLAFKLFFLIHNFVNFGPMWKHRVAIFSIHIPIHSTHIQAKNWVPSSWLIFTKEISKKKNYNGKSPPRNFKIFFEVQLITYLNRSAQKNRVGVRKPSSVLCRRLYIYFFFVDILYIHGECHWTVKIVIMPYEINKYGTNK